MSSSPAKPEKSTTTLDRILAIEIVRVTERAAVAADRSRAASGAVDVIISQPAMSTTCAVASVEPPSTTITWLTVPDMAPGTSIASVGTSARSWFFVGMMTVSMIGHGGCGNPA